MSADRLPILPNRVYPFPNGHSGSGAALVSCVDEKPSGMVTFVRINNLEGGVHRVPRTEFETLLRGELRERIRLYKNNRPETAAQFEQLLAGNNVLPEAKVTDFLRVGVEVDVADNTLIRNVRPDHPGDPWYHCEQYGSVIGTKGPAGQDCYRIFCRWSEFKERVMRDPALRVVDVNLEAHQEAAAVGLSVEQATVAFEDHREPETLNVSGPKDDLALCVAYLLERNRERLSSDTNIVFRNSGGEPISVSASMLLAMHANEVGVMTGTAVSAEVPDRTRDLMTPVCSLSKWSETGWALTGYRRGDGMNRLKDITDETANEIGSVANACAGITLPPPNEVVLGSLNAVVTALKLMLPEYVKLSERNHRDGGFKGEFSPEKVPAAALAIAALDQLGASGWKLSQRELQHVLRTVHAPTAEISSTISTLAQRVAAPHAERNGWEFTPSLQAISGAIQREPHAGEAMKPVQSKPRRRK